MKKNLNSLGFLKSEVFLQLDTVASCHCDSGLFQSLGKKLVNRGTLSWCSGQRMCNPLICL